MGRPMAAMTCTGTHTITREEATAGRFDNSAFATGRDVAGADLRSDPSEVSVPVEPPRPEPFPVVSKSASHSEVRPGDEVEYTVRIRNAGEGPLGEGLLNDDLSGVLDDGVLVGQPTATHGTVSVNGKQLVWVGTLQPNEEAVITYRVRAERGGDGQMRNVVSGLGTCASGSSEPPCGTVVHVEEPTSPPPPVHEGYLTITKWADREFVRPGSGWSTASR